MDATGVADTTEAPQQIVIAAGEGPGDASARHESSRILRLPVRAERNRGGIGGSNSNAPPVQAPRQPYPPAAAPPFPLPSPRTRQVHIGEVCQGKGGDSDDEDGVRLQWHQRAPSWQPHPETAAPSQEPDPLSEKKAMGAAELSTDSTSAGIIAAGSNSRGSSLGSSRALLAVAYQSPALIDAGSFNLGDGQTQPCRWVVAGPQADPQINPHTLSPDGPPDGPPDGCDEVPATSAYLVPLRQAAKAPPPAPPHQTPLSHTLHPVSGVRQTAAWTMMAFNGEL